jgi:predicted site-specific integrase-resolvase
MKSTEFIPQKTMFRPDEVARLFGIHVCTLKRWRDEGIITGLKLSKHCVRYSRAEIIQLMVKKTDDAE